MTVLKSESTKTLPALENEECSLSNNVRQALECYFADLDGHDAINIYDLFLTQFEKPLFEFVLQECHGNITHAARMLGLNRGTLRNRLKKYDLD